MKTTDLILHNAIVITMDEAFNVFEPGAVVISKDKIVAVGLEDTILSMYQSDTMLDCHERILLPGLINAHTHVPMTLLRGLADDLRLDVWLMGYMMPVEREFVSPEFVRLGTKLACAEMIRSGITCFADMYYFEDDVAKATAESGLRAVCGQSVMKYPSPDAGSYEESLVIARKFIKKWKGHPLIIPSVAPHAVYTCTEEILKACSDLAIEFDVPLHIHISETSNEVENLRKEQGMPVVPYLKKYGILDTKLIAAHCVHIDEGEIRSLQHANAGIAHNPSSNMKLASGFAPVVKMLELGVNVGIGTDGTASNNDLDMIDEMRLATFMAKNITNDPTAVPAKQALSMATSMGAKALHIDDITGSLVPGKRADLIILDINKVHNSPRFRRDRNGIYAQIVFASKSTDITDVMVNGEWLMKDHILLTLNEEQLLLEGNKIAQEIDLFLSGREESVLSKLIAIGGAMEQESFEIQAKVKIIDPQIVINKLSGNEIKIIRSRYYHEYDTYFTFSDESQGRLRYREDEFLDKDGKPSTVRTRLTLIGTKNESNLDNEVMLSRSRYYAPAIHSLRFYREYFQPVSEIEVEKLRKRYLIHFNGIDFFVNVDTLLQPAIGHFLEIKSRTWSRQDAETKSLMVAELINYLGSSAKDAVTNDYIKIVEDLL
ncbi:MAG: amidohydrolase [Anaerolineaceae bacterium]|nr:amidohydrolase [Anaerolineaceae bacterium]